MPVHEFFHYTNFDAAHARRISYILFTRNRGSQLGKTIADVTRSLRADDELIVVDGASTDSTEEVVIRHRNSVHIFLSEHDRSAQHAVNKGVLLSQGKYIILLPDEDRVHSSGVEMAVEVMEKNPHIDLLVCGGTKHFLVRKMSRVFYYGPGMNYGSTVELQCTHGSCANAFFIRRSVFAKVGLFPLDSIAWDPMWVVQCIYYGGVVKFARINFFDHYITEDSISHTREPEMRAERMRFVKMYGSPEFARAYCRERSIWYRLFGIRRVKNFVYSARKVLRKHGAGGLVYWVVSRSKKGTGKKRPLVTPVWDGGFS